MDAALIDDERAAEATRVYQQARDAFANCIATMAEYDEARRVYMAEMDEYDKRRHPPARRQP